MLFSKRDRGHLAYENSCHINPLFTFQKFTQEIFVESGLIRGEHGVRRKPRVWDIFPFYIKELYNGAYGGHTAPS